MDKPKRKTFNTSLDEDLLRRLKILAATEGCRINDLLEDAITDLLSKYDKPHAPRK